MTTHPSNRISMDNLKTFIYWLRPTPEQVTRMDGIAQRCEDLMWANAAIVLEQTVESI